MTTPAEPKLDVLPVVTAALWNAWKAVEEALVDRFGERARDFHPVFSTRLSYIFDPDKFQREEKTDIFKGDVDLVVVQWLKTAERGAEVAGEDCAVALVLDLVTDAAADGITRRRRGVEREAFLKRYGLPYIPYMPHEASSQVAAVVKKMGDFPVRQGHVGQQLRMRPSNRLERLCQWSMRLHLRERNLIAIPEVVFARLVDLSEESPSFERYRAAASRSLGRLSSIKDSRVDLAICTGGPFCIPVTLFEYDGPYHDRADQREKDALKDALAAAAGLPVCRVRTSKGTSAEEVQQIDWMARAISSYLPQARLEGAVRRQVVRLVRRKAKQLPPGSALDAEDFRALATELEGQIEYLETELREERHARQAAQAALAEEQERFVSSLPSGEPEQLDWWAESAKEEFVDRALTCAREGGAIHWQALGAEAHYREEPPDEHQPGRRTASLMLVPSAALAAVRGSAPLVTAAAAVPVALRCAGPAGEAIQRELQDLIWNHLLRDCLKRIESQVVTLLEQHLKGLGVRSAQRLAESEEKRWRASSPAGQEGIIQGKFPRVGRLQREVDHARMLLERTDVAPEELLHSAEALEYTMQWGRASVTLEGERLGELLNRIERWTADPTSAAHHQQLARDLSAKAIEVWNSADSCREQLEAALRSTPRGREYEAFVRKTRETRPNAYRPWVATSPFQLLKLKHKGHTLESIAQEIGRTVEEVSARLKVFDSQTESEKGSLMIDHLLEDT